MGFSLRSKLLLGAGVLTENHDENHLVRLIDNLNFGGQRKPLYQTDKQYYVYIVTNPTRTTLYIGVTNNLEARLSEHWINRGLRGTFAGEYYCYNLIYYEIFTDINQAIARDTELKKWSRKKKEALIASKNPQWHFLNFKFCKIWPPQKPGGRGF